MEITSVGSQHRIQLVMGEKQVVGIGDGAYQMSQTLLEGLPTPLGGLWGQRAEKAPFGGVGIYLQNSQSRLLELSFQAETSAKPVFGEGIATGIEHSESSPDQIPFAASALPGIKGLTVAGGVILEAA